MDKLASLPRARRLRTRSTYAHAALWSYLRGRRIAGFRFRRQVACGPFVVDFFCAQRRLAVELDAGQRHQRRTRAHHHRRAAFLACHGITVLRFPCDQILRNPAAVLTVIAFALGGEGSSSLDS
jgi:very-short-patch-repair endonuclease